MRKSWIVLCLLLASNCAWCKSTKNAWENLNTLQTGARIQIVERNLAKVSGAFVSVNAEGITLYEKNGKATIDRNDVARVQVGGKRGRHMLLGIGIGAGAGAAFGAISHSACKDCIVTSGQDIGAGVILGVAVGAIVGAVLPGSRTVYQAGSR